MSGNLEDITLNDDEGIGERTAFLYHIPTRVIILERTQSGVSIIGFTKYFQYMSGINEPISVDPVLNGNAMTKLNRMREIQKFEIRIAGLDNPGQLFAGSDEAVNEIARIANTFRAPSLSLVVSMAQKRDDSLSLENVLQTARRFLTITESYRGSNSVNNRLRANVIRITGSTDEDHGRLLVDLIKDRMRHEVSINYGGRGIPYLERRQALQTAWQQHELEIRGMFLPA